MRRLAFRRLLPIVQLALFLVLLPLGEAQQRWHDEEQRRNAERYPITEDGWIVMTFHEDQYEPPAHIVLFALNAPAFLPVVLYGIVREVFEVPLDDETWWLHAHLLWVFGAAVLWYFVGDAFDRYLAGVDSAPAEVVPGRTKVVLTFLSAVVLALVAIALLVFYLNSYWSPPFSIELWLALWFGLATLVQWRKLARWRTARNPTTLHLQPNR